MFLSRKKTEERYSYTATAKYVDADRSHHQNQQLYSQLMRCQRKNQMMRKKAPHLIDQYEISPRTHASFIRRVRNIVACYPSIYIRAIRFTSRRDFAVRRDTEIIIEGFPRSGNSFAHAAFRLAQNRPVRIAHHCHAPAQVIAAYRWRLPTLVLFREPDDAVASLLLFSPEVYSPVDAYREYVRFYRAIMSIKEGYVLATFEAITKRFGDVIRKVNQTFGTTFEEFEHSEQMVRVAYEEVNRLSKIMTGTEKPDYNILHNDDYRKYRNAVKDRIKKDVLQDTKTERAQAMAKAVYAKLFQISDI